MLHFWTLLSPFKSININLVAIPKSASNFLDLNNRPASFHSVIWCKLIIVLGVITISWLNTLCTPLVWMKIAAIATLYTTSGYVISCSVQILCPAANAGSAVYKILYPAVNAGSAMYKIFTLQMITYLDAVYKVATAAILIQTWGVQSVLSLEISVIDDKINFRRFTGKAWNVVLISL